MGISLVVLALAATIAAPAGVANDRLENQVRAEIMPSFEAMQAAANVHDADAHVGYFARDPNLIFMINGRRIVGWEAVLDQQRKWWPNGRIVPGSGTEVPYRLTAGPDFIVLGPGSALVSFMLDAPKTDQTGTRINRTLAISHLWQKRPEGWRVTYAQESVSVNSPAD